MKVLMIDGPMRGEVWNGTDSRAVQFVDYGSVSDPTREDAPIGTYFIHRYVLAGRVLLLGSTEYAPSGELADDLFWELLASDIAKDVAQPLDASR